MKNKIETDLLMGELIYKHLRGEICPEEQELLDSWAANPENKDFFFALENTDQLYQKMMYIQDIDTDAQFRKLQRKKKTQVHRRIWQWWSGIAALLVIGIGSFLMWKQTAPEAETPFISKLPDVLADHTVLVTAEGKQIYFADTVKEISAADNALQEKVVAMDSPVALKYNTLATSSRRMIEMQLSDSSRVWLNASSELYYPEIFGKDKRVVYLKGEAYFEVTKARDRPFIVKAGDARIEVLGTQFDVKVTDDRYCVTTLVKGCVKVYNRKNDSLVILPGQQVETRPDGKMWMRPVDTRYYTAWRKNQFAFHEETLLGILNTLAGWYNFTFAFEDIRLSEQIYTAIFPRSPQVDDILQILERTEDFEYIREKDNHILIRRNKR